MRLPGKKKRILISVTLLCLLLTATLFADASGADTVERAGSADAMFSGGAGGLIIRMPSEKTLDSGAWKAYFPLSLQNITGVPGQPGGDRRRYAQTVSSADIYNAQAIVHHLCDQDGKK